MNLLSLSSSLWILNALIVINITDGSDDHIKRCESQNEAETSKSNQKIKIKIKLSQKPENGPKEQNSELKPKPKRKIKKLFETCEGNEAENKTERNPNTKPRTKKMSDNTENRENCTPRRAYQGTTSYTTPNTPQPQQTGGIPVFPGFNEEPKNDDMPKKGSEQKAGAATEPEPKPEPKTKPEPKSKERTPSKKQPAKSSEEKNNVRKSKKDKATFENMSEEEKRIQEKIKEQNKQIDRVLKCLNAKSCTPFKILGVPKNTDQSECSKAYKRLALLIHTDKCQHPEARRVIQAVTAAKNQISELFEAKAQKASLKEKHPYTWKAQTGGNGASSSRKQSQNPTNANSSTSRKPTQKPTSTNFPPPPSYPGESSGGRKVYTNSNESPATYPPECVQPEMFGRVPPPCPAYRFSYGWSSEFDMQEGRWVYRASCFIPAGFFKYQYEYPEGTILKDDYEIVKQATHVLYRAFIDVREYVFHLGDKIKPEKRITVREIVEYDNSEINRRIISLLKKLSTEQELATFDFNAKSVELSDLSNVFVRIEEINKNSIKFAGFVRLKFGIFRGLAALCVVELRTLHYEAEYAADLYTKTFQCLEKVARACGMKLMYFQTYYSELRYLRSVLETSYKILSIDDNNGGEKIIYFGKYLDKNFEPPPEVIIIPE